MKEIVTLTYIVWAASAATSSCVAILHATPSWIRSDVGTVSGKQLGLAFHPNSLASSIAVTLPVFIAMLFGNRYVTTLIAILGISVGTAGLLSADSRTGLVVGGLVGRSGSALIVRRGSYAFGVPVVLTVLFFLDSVSSG